MENELLKNELKELLGNRYSYQYILQYGISYLFITTTKLTIDANDLDMIADKIKKLGFALIKTEYAYGFKSLIFKELIKWRLLMKKKQ